MDAKPLYLKALNAAQLKAVTHDPSIPLQILAGPGSGKTRVLTSRVAYLVQHHKIIPQSICAVTFTNKAANEMRHRLKPLIGEQETGALVMGTFHAICSKYLRKFGQRIRLPNNFSISDADESKKLMKQILRTKDAYLKSKSMELKEGDVLSQISKAKSKAQSPSDILLEAKTEKNQFKELISELYEDYEALLKKNNALDFDDLLVYGVRLFKASPRILAGCAHILVDEFQDTSILQYELVKHFAAGHKCISIVGDPDQSIYGWRAAEIENLQRMTRDFPGTEQILLEENYRSTGAILQVSHAIMAQDTTRIEKGLFTSHAMGPMPVLLSRLHEHAEADFIADEIKRTMAYSGGMLNWSDFAILLRYNALSRAIESALQRQGIPMRMLAGQKFFDRAEIKDVLAYLQLVDNPRYDPAFNRIVNVPPRALGDKSIVEIDSIAKSNGCSCMEAAERIVQGKVSGKDSRVTNKLQKGLAPFVKTIKALQAAATSGLSVADLIGQLIDSVNYQAYLRKSNPDSDSRWENIQELISFAQEVSGEENNAIGGSSEPPSHASQFVLDDDGNFAEIKVDPEQSDTPLRVFLQASSLSTDTETTEPKEGEDEANTAKVTVSTCHAAKGLEWPVVFIPGVEEGIFPFYRTEDEAEERRLLYVACTRAQSMLCLTHALSRKSGGVPRDNELCPFIKGVLSSPVAVLSSGILPTLHTEELDVIGRVLGRPVPDAATIASKVRSYQPMFVPTRDSESAPGPTVGTSALVQAVHPRGPHRAIAPQTARPIEPYIGPVPTFSSATSLHRAGPASTISLVTAQFSAPVPSIIPRHVTGSSKATLVASSSKPVSKSSVAAYFPKTTHSSKNTSANVSVKTEASSSRSITTRPLAMNNPAISPRVMEWTAQTTLALGQTVEKPSPQQTIKKENLGTRAGSRPSIPSASTQVAGVKRRLGMGRAPDGFTAPPVKKHKAP